MTEEGCSFAAALAEAQELGYAEPDPTADVDGFDAAAKAAIIASIAFGARVVAGDVSREGIRDVTADDIGAAAELGYVVKLLAVAEEHDGAVSARVHPAMVPVGHPLASVRGSFNAVFIEGEAVGAAHVAGPGRRRRPHVERAARRSHRRGQEPALRRTRRDGRGARAAPDPPDRRDVVAVLRVARRGRPAGRARDDLRRVRAARGVDPVDAAEGPGRRRPSDLRHARRAARPTSPRRSAPCASSRRSSGSARCCESSEARNDGAGARGMARHHRGVPRPAARYRRHAGRDPERRATRRWSTRPGSRSRSARGCC